MLVSTDQLAGHLGDPEWVIFDCRHDLSDMERGIRVYRDGHIAGSHFASVETDLAGPKTGNNGRHPLPLPEVFVDFLSGHGVSNTSTVVAYDDVGGSYAARLWWMARWVGLTRVLLLDGGFSKWIAEGRAVTAEIPDAKRVPLAVHADAALNWTSADVMRHLRNPEIALIDARTAERYRGEIEPIDPIAGHIPGALNRFHKANLNLDLTFRPPAELRQEFGRLVGTRSPDQVVHYCGSGVTACANLFAMEYAGLAGSKLYSGSWSEWIADASHPILPARS